MTSNRIGTPIGCDRVGPNRPRIAPIGPAPIVPSFVTSACGCHGSSPNPKLRKQGRIGLGIAALATTAALASGCSVSSTPANQDVANQRYHDCLAAGGSYWTDDTDWGCNLPGTESGR